MDRLKQALRPTRERSPTPHGTTSWSDPLIPPQTGPYARPDEATSTASIVSGVIGPQPTTALDEIPASILRKPLPNPPGGASLQRDFAAEHETIHHPFTSIAIPGRHSSLRKPDRLSPPQALRPSAGTRQTSIGIRRVPSSQSLARTGLSGAGSASPDWSNIPQTGSELPTLTEEPVNKTAEDDTLGKKYATTWSKTRLAVRRTLGLERRNEDVNQYANGGSEYDPNMVDLLDTVDPEVATLTSLTNVQNSLFIPDLGKYVNRRPIYTVTNRLKKITGTNKLDLPTIEEPAEEQQTGRPSTVRRMQTDTRSMFTINSTLSDSRYAVLLPGASLAGWTTEEKKELNDLVRHMMHSRKSRMKRSLNGFGQSFKGVSGAIQSDPSIADQNYSAWVPRHSLRGPLTLFGLAWVLYLIGWVNVGGKQLYVVNVIDNVLVALFAIVGDGLAPFRAVDTYHMIFIAHYYRLTWRLRKEKQLPTLQDHNDLPTQHPELDVDVEAGKGEFTVLTAKQQERLNHHQSKFAKSHTFFKPHETETHFAFPIRLLIAIVVLLDCHSLFQIALGACTWSINYHHRPFALTTVILCCSISSNASAGILIMTGDRRTRKKDVLERMNRQELTNDAMDKLEQRWETDREEGPISGRK